MNLSGTRLTSRLGAALVFVVGGILPVAWALLTSRAAAASTGSTAPDQHAVVAGFELGDPMVVAWAALTVVSLVTVMAMAGRSRRRTLTSVS